MWMPRSTRAATLRARAPGASSPTSLRRPPATELATLADQAVFSGATRADEDALAFWRLVDAERLEIARGQGFWRRVAATVSLRSFIRHVAPVSGVRKRITERGKRRAAEPVRLTP